MTTRSVTAASDKPRAGVESTDPDLMLPKVVYEGQALLEIARRAATTAERDEAWAKGRRQLDQFLREQPAHEYAHHARLWRARIVVEQTDALMARKPPDLRIDDIRDAYLEAEQEFETGLTIANERHRSAIHRGCWAPVDNQSLVRGRREFSAIITFHFDWAAAATRLAATYPRNHAESRRLLTVAADRHHEFYRRYRWIICGIEARLCEGRCRQDLGDYAAAAAAYDDVLATPADELPALRPLWFSALVGRAECAAAAVASDWAGNFRRQE